MNDHNPESFGALSPAEFGRRYGMSVSKAYGLLRRGELRAVKMGRHTRIRVREAERWVSTLPLRSPGPQPIASAS